MAFAEAVAANLERVDPAALPEVAAPAWADTASAQASTPTPALPDRITVTTRDDIGFDLFFEVENADPAELGAEITALAEGSPFRLKHLSNRGTAIWPGAVSRTELTPHWRARFVRRADAAAGFDDAAALALIGKVGARHRWMHVEKLLVTDGADGFSRDQGEA